MPLRDHTTLRGGPAARWVEAATEVDLVGAVQRADEAGQPVLVLGGGSNVVVPDEGFPGSVVHVATVACVRTSTRDLEAETLAACGGGVSLTVAAGESWTTWSRTPSSEAGWAFEAPSASLLGGRHPDPECRRLRPGGGRHGGSGPHLGPTAPSAPSPWPTALRLPHQSLKAEPGRFLVLEAPPAEAGRPVRADPATPSSLACSRSTSATAPPSPRCATQRATPQQGHGPGCRRPR
ncbi:MAG: hypothetical protein R2734_03000 [Nocardioides sp.]